MMLQLHSSQHSCRTCGRGWCVPRCCSAWCFVSRPLVSLVMPLSIRGSEKPCWMPLARSSVMLAQRYVKRVTLLSNSDRVW